jgi:hypothetical protein
MTSSHRAYRIWGWHGQTCLPVVFLLTCIVSALAADRPGYSQNFEQAKEGKAPEDLVILAGQFQVKSIENNKLLEVAPHPLESFSLLFGPADQQACTVSARIKATNTGRRFPEFGVGALGPSGYKLWLMPATGQLQLKAGDQTLTHVPFEWKSGTWTRLKLALTKPADNKMKLQGKAWPDGQPEPRDWTISVEINQPPKPGKASIWATPYSGTAVQFDDLSVTAGP